MSPFKTEKTPSFFVNDQKGFYHCFASGEHGDIFTFLMKTEGLSFDDAVKQLAAEAGIAIPKPPGAASTAAAKKPEYRFTIPKRLPMLLRRLKFEYEREGRKDLLEILANATVHVEEGVERDGSLGGDLYGHNFTFVLPIEILGHVPLASQDDVCDRIRRDLALATKPVSNEFVSRVTLDVIDDDSAPGRIPTAPAANQPADWSADFWKPDHFRLFISHRDSDKLFAHQLAEAFEPYGISAFVAHDDIEPDNDWQIEIEKGLHTMEVMLALITDDFYASAWTQQEAGFALGRQVPVVCAKAGAVDPRGFIGKKQAIKIDATDAVASARQIVAVVAKYFDASKFRDILIEKFTKAGSFAQAEVAFDRLKVVDGYNQTHADAVISAFSENSQLNCCWYLTRSTTRLTDFLSQCTGKSYHIADRRIEEDEIW